MSIQRDQILRCACDLYLSEGFEGFSMRKLAGCVGCTAPALYRHYENKEEVLRDVVSEAYKQFTLYLYRALEGRTPEDRFRMAGWAYLDFALENPGLYEALYLPLDMIGISPDSGGQVMDQACAVGQFWSDRVREMMDAGHFQEGDVDEVSLVLWAQAHGMVSLFHRGLLRVQDKNRFRSIMGGAFRRVLRGIGTGGYMEMLDERAAEEMKLWVGKAG